MSQELKQFHQSMRLGKSDARIDSRTLQLGKYFRLGALPAPPKSINWTTKVSSWPMLANDVVGDCTIAAILHFIQLWLAANGITWTPTSEEAIALYSSITGYIPGQPSTDNGAVEVDVLNYIRQTGTASGHKILAYASVNVQNEQEIQQAIALFGGVYIGLSMPLAWQNTKNWDVARGFLARAKKLFGSNWTPGSWGGHAVPLPAYATINGSKYTVITWGSADYTITSAALAEYCDEMYVILSQDWLDAQGKAPVGLDLAQLQADLAQIT